MPNPNEKRPLTEEQKALMDLILGDLTVSQYQQEYVNSLLQQHDAETEEEKQAHYRRDMLCHHGLREPCKVCDPYVFAMKQQRKLAGYRAHTSVVDDPEAK